MAEPAAGAMRQAGYPHQMVNAGISGDTTAGALRPLDAALTPDTRVLIIALGANDGVVGNPDLNLADGIHPNAAGMQRIADEMWPFLESLLR